MTSVGSRCQSIRVVAFRGDRSAAYRTGLIAKMDAEDPANNVPGPTREEALLWAGHAGISWDDGATVFGFNPNPGNMTTKALLNHLMSHLSVPGQVLDDTAIFQAASVQPGLNFRQFEVLLPQARYDEIKKLFDEERRNSNYTYGYPSGDGDCNCATWIERLGIPVISGEMVELEVLLNYSLTTLNFKQRRFGACIP